MNTQNTERKTVWPDERQKPAELITDGFDPLPRELGFAVEQSVTPGQLDIPVGHIALKGGYEQRKDQ